MIHILCVAEDARVKSDKGREKKQESAACPGGMLRASAPHSTAAHPLQIPASGYRPPANTPAWVWNQR